MTNKSEMKMRVFKRTLLCTALMAAMSQANAASFDLCAGTTTLTMPDGVTTVTMWGYGLDTGGTCSPTIPGPRLTVPPGDTTLTINLRNELSEPVSIIVPALSSTEAPAPVLFDNGDGTGRMRAFSIVKEAAAGGGTNTYSFNAQPGTYLYQSGSHMSVQVQMGLYGMATQDFAAGMAYDGVAYDNEVVQLYSEIDPALHAAVAGGSYGTAAMPSAVHYLPKYYLVNGAPYSGTTAHITGPAVGQKTLIRMANAGLEPHVPFILNGSMSVVAEYGHLYPYARDQFSVLLVAQQTRDAILEPTSTGTMAMYDRRLRLTNNTDTGAGGLMSFIDVAAATGGGGSAPVAVNDLVVTDEDTAALINVVLNDTDVDGDLVATTVAVVTQPLNGIAVNNGDGTVTYTPNPNFNGADSFTYTVKDAANNISNVATVSVTVNPVNDLPVAVADNYNAIEAVALNVAAPGVLSNDSDVDGDALTAVLDTDVTGGVLALSADGSFTYTANVGTTSDSFTYHANDGIGDSNIVTVTISVTPPPPPPGNASPVAVDDYMGTVTRNLGTSTANSVTMDVTANDTDSDGTINPATVVITTNGLLGTAVSNGDGTVTYTPAGGKSGSDAFAYTVQDDQGAVSNAATVRVDVVK